MWMLFIQFALYLVVYATIAFHFGCASEKAAGGLRWTDVEQTRPNRRHTCFNLSRKITDVQSSRSRLVRLRVYLCRTIVECFKMAVRIHWIISIYWLKGKCERSLRVKWIADRIQIECACSGLSVRLCGSISMSENTQKAFDGERERYTKQFECAKSNDGQSWELYRMCFELNRHIWAW